MRGFESLFADEGRTITVSRSSSNGRTPALQAGYGSSILLDRSSSTSPPGETEWLGRRLQSGYMPVRLRSGRLCGRSSVGRAPPCQGGGRGVGARRPLHAVVAQLAERLLPKQEVAGSEPASRSISTSLRASVAQWQSGCLVNSRSRARFPAEALRSFSSAVVRAPA